jgi:hypothetical protein
MMMTSEKWLREVQEGVDMLVRNHVRVEAISHKFGLTIRFNGEEIQV